MATPTGSVLSSLAAGGQERMYHLGRRGESATMKRKSGSHHHQRVGESWKKGPPLRADNLGWLADLWNIPHLNDFFGPRGLEKSDMSKVFAKGGVHRSQGGDQKGWLSPSLHKFFGIQHPDQDKAILLALQARSKVKELWQKAGEAKDKNSAIRLAGLARGAAAKVAQTEAAAAAKAKVDAANIHAKIKKVKKAYKGAKKALRLATGFRKLAYEADASTQASLKAWIKSDKIARDKKLLDDSTAGRDTRKRQIEKAKATKEAAAKALIAVNVTGTAKNVAVKAAAAAKELAATDDTNKAAGTIANKTAIAAAAANTTYFAAKKAAAFAAGNATAAAKRVVDEKTSVSRNIAEFIRTASALKAAISEAAKTTKARVSAEHLVSTRAKLLSDALVKYTVAKEFIRKAATMAKIAQLVAKSGKLLDTVAMKAYAKKLKTIKPSSGPGPGPAPSKKISKEETNGTKSSNATSAKESKKIEDKKASVAYEVKALYAQAARIANMTASSKKTLAIQVLVERARKLDSRAGSSAARALYARAAQVAKMKDGPAKVKAIRSLILLARRIDNEPKNTYGHVREVRAL